MEEKDKRNTGKCSASRFSCAGNLVWGIIFAVFFLTFIVTTIK
jgi:hypothetical protein